MTINHVVPDHVLFEDLEVGDVFIDLENNDYFMKTEISFECYDNEDDYLNAVALKDGSLYKFYDEETVVCPKKAYLTVEA